MTRDNINKDRFRRILLGGSMDQGVVKKFVIYFFLIGLGFVYLYPFLYMLSTSLKDSKDLIDPTVMWLPTRLYLGNYESAFNVLETAKTLITTVVIAGLCAMFQTIASAITGYGLARFDFRGKRLWFILLVTTFIIPTQVTIIPKYILFDKYKLIGTPLCALLPALLGHGVKGALFIFIFYQFFRSYPKALDEAAEIDGAGKVKIFMRIAIPMAVPAIVVSFLFSLVWNWNETYMSGLFFGENYRTLPMQLSNFVSAYSAKYPVADGDEVNRLNESIRMAGTMITMLPLLLTYTILQKQFVESVDKTGITGE